MPGKQKRNYGGQKLAITIEMNSERFVVTYMKTELDCSEASAMSGKNALTL
jgi:hypothetical protein